MRVRTKVWIAVVTACVALTVYEIPNSRLIWRYVRMAGSVKQKLKDITVLESVLTEDVVATDPEVADILTYCLTDPNYEELGDLAAKYPDNEFFLAQLAYELSDVNLVDARAALSLTERLIELNPENAHYRYIKGWLLLRPPWGAEHEQEALEQFKQGNDLPEFYLPYSKYGSRVDRLCDEARIGILDRRRAVPRETGWYWDLRMFINRSRGTYPKLSSELFGAISPEVSEVADRIIDHASTDGSLEAGCLLLQCIEWIRLKELDLMETEVQQVRFRLSRSIEIKKVLSDYMTGMFDVFADLMKITLVVTVAIILLLPLPLPLVWIFVIIVNRLRGQAEHVPVDVKAYILFVVGLIISVGFTVLLALLSKVFTGQFLGCLAFAGLAIIIWTVIWLLARIRPVDRARFRDTRRWAAFVCTGLWLLGLATGIIVCVFVLEASAVTEWLVFAGGLLVWTLLCAVVWSIVTYKRHVFRAIPYNRLVSNRFVQLVLVLLLMTGINGLLRPVPVVLWISVFFTILLVGLVATHVSESRLICLDAVRRFFCRDGQIVVARTKMARIMSAILLSFWVMILIGVHMSARRWSRLDTLLTDPLSSYRPLPRATQETYERVLSKTYSTDPNAPVRPRFKEDGGLPEELYLASPEDLLALVSRREAEGNPIREKLLLYTATRGGHDIRPIILKALRNPNALDVLIARAKWKDMSAKEQLDLIFEEKMTRLAQTIAPIRKDPNSAESLIIRVNWGDDTVKGLLKQALEAKMVELSERVRDAGNSSELRSELTTLLEMDSALPGSSSQSLKEYEYALMMAGEHDLMLPFGMNDPNALSEFRTGRDRSLRVRQLIIDANMPELLKRSSPKEMDGPEILTSLLKIAGALAYISDPQEAEARFSRLLDFAGEWQNSGSSIGQRRSEVVDFNAGLWAGDIWWQPCIFYRALTGVPKTGVITLLKDYVLRRQLADPFEEMEFLDVLNRAGDRELAEWVFREVVASPPTAEVPYSPGEIPIGRPIHVSEVNMKKRRKDISYSFLEPAFPHLGIESIPLLLEHFGSDNDQLRAFIVWRVTSLGYEWPNDKLRELLKDEYWKVRLNTLFALEKDNLAEALDDENAFVRVVARMLHQGP